MRKVTILITELLKEVRTSQISAKPSRPRSFPRNKWFDMECKTMKRKVNDAKKRFTCQPHVLHLREAYFMGKKQYRKLLKRKKEAATYTLHHLLINTHRNNPRKFWKLLSSAKSMDDTNTPINPQALLNHFKTLNET